MFKGLKGTYMKLSKILLLFTFVISHFAYAEELNISAKEHLVTNDAKIQTFIGDVEIRFSENEHPETESNSVSMANGKTVMEGDVKITFDHITAVTDRVVYVETPTGLVARMDKVVITYH